MPRTNSLKYIIEKTHARRPPVRVQFYGFLLNANRLWTPRTHGLMGPRVRVKPPFLTNPPNLASAGNEAPDLGGSTSLPWMEQNSGPEPSLLLLPMALRLSSLKTGPVCPACSFRGAAPPPSSPASGSARPAESPLLAGATKDSLRVRTPSRAVTAPANGSPCLSTQVRAARNPLLWAHLEMGGTRLPPGEPTLGQDTDPGLPSAPARVQPPGPWSPAQWGFQKGSSSCLRSTEGFGVRSLLERHGGAGGRPGFPGFGGESLYKLETPSSPIGPTSHKADAPPTCTRHPALCPHGTGC